MTYKDKIKLKKEAKIIFKVLKIDFIFIIILYYIDLLKMLYIEINASNSILGIILSQIKAYDKLYLISFYWIFFNRWD